MSKAKAVNSGSGANMSCQTAYSTGWNSGCGRLGKPSFNSSVCGAVIGSNPAGGRELVIDFATSFFSLSRSSVGKIVSV